MSVERPGDDAMASPYDEGEDAGASRPWTPAAAMELLPPLAPPPARPGAGTAVAALPDERARAGGTGVRTTVALALVVIVAVVLLVVLLTGH